MWPNYSQICRKAVDTLLDGKHSLTGYRSNKAWGIGPQKWSWANKFERELEKRFKVKHAIALNSGTMALKASLFALNLPPGSEVLVPPFSFSATVAAPILMGHKPVFVDVDPYTFTMDPEKVKKAITKKTRAIIPVDLFGGLANYEALEKFGLPIISDHCQAVGTQKDGKYRFGLISANSGNGGKNLPLGEGGWCLTDDSKLAERMRLFISHAENFDVDFVGENGRMPEMTACVAYHGLLELEERNTRRQELAADFYHTIRYYKDEPRVVRKDHVYYVTPFTCHKYSRSYFMAEAKKVGLNVGAGYITPPLYFYPAFKKYAKGRQLYTVNELSTQSLYILPDLTPDKPKGYGKEVGMKVRKIFYGDRKPV